MCTQNAQNVLQAERETVETLWKRTHYFLEELKIELAYDLAILLQNNCRESKVSSCKSTCLPICAAELATVTKKIKSFPNIRLWMRKYPCTKPRLRALKGTYTQVTARMSLWDATP